jgi:hypothetical protein
MKKITTALLSLAIMAGLGLTATNAEALSWAQKRANNEEIREAIQTKRTNYYRGLKRSEYNYQNRNVLKAYHNKNIWDSFVSRRSTELKSAEGNVTDRDMIRENTGYVDAANNSKMNSKKAMLCYYLLNKASGEECYTLGQINGEENVVSQKQTSMYAADRARIMSAVRDLNKAAMQIDFNEDTKKRHSNYTTNDFKRNFDSPYQKSSDINIDELDI